jgi:hypothetical protein
MQRRITVRLDEAEHAAVLAAARVRHTTPSAVIRDALAEMGEPTPQTDLDEHEVRQRMAAKARQGSVAALSWWSRRLGVDRVAHTPIGESDDGERAEILRLIHGQDAS